MNRICTSISIAVLGCVASAATTASAIDGAAIPTDFNGYLVASQANATGFGNGFNGFVTDFSIGSELDALYVTSDAQNLWIGVTGNLPNKLASGQSIILLLQVNDPDFIPDPNLLVTSGLPGFGGGFQSLLNLNGLTMPGGDLTNGFYPDYAIVVNRSVSAVPNSLTYGNAWYLPTNLELPYDPNITSENPANVYADGINVGQPLYMSVWTSTTNTAGVTATSQPADGIGPGTQGALAATAIQGLRVRLSLNDNLTQVFGIGAFQTIKLAVILAAPDGTVSNQTLPPMTPVLSPTFNDCFPSTQPVSQGAGTFDPVYFKTQDPSYSLFTSVTLNPTLGTPGATGLNATDIPAGFTAARLRATQQLHTCFGDTLPSPNPPIPYTVPGSELDQLFVKRDADVVNGYLNIGVTGNMEANSNKVYLFVDTGDPVQYNVLSNVGDVNDGFNGLRTWSGRKFDPGFNPRYVYMLNNTSGTLYVDAFDLSIPYVASVSNPKRFLGSVPVGSGSGVLTGGDNLNNDEFALDNSNMAGVDGGNPGAPGDPSTATTGLEAKIKLSEIGVTSSTCKIRVAAMLSGTDGGGRSFLSNQSLPSYAPMSANVGADPINGTTTQPFDFGDDTDNPTTDPFEGKPAFAGGQFATVQRQAGDVKDDGNNCINAADAAQMTNVLLGTDTDPCNILAADVFPVGNPDGIVNGKDIQTFVDILLSQPPCP